MAFDFNAGTPVAATKTGGFDFNAGTPVPPPPGPFGGALGTAFTPSNLAKIPGQAVGAIKDYGTSVINSAIGGINQATGAINDSGAGQNPISTGAKFGAGLVNVATAPVAPLFKPLGDAIDAATQPIQNNPAVQKFAVSPAGKATSAAAETVGNLDAIAGAVAGGSPGGRAALGDAADTTISNTVGKTDARYGQVPPPPPKVPGATSGASTALMNKVARINPSDARDFSTMSGGQTPGQFLDARGIYGNQHTVMNQLFDRFTQSKGAVDDALAKLPGLYKSKAVETALSDVVDHATMTSAPGVVSPYLTQAQSLLAKAQNGGLSMSEINAAKRLYEGTVKMNYIKDGVSTGIERANNIDSTIRSWQQSTADKLGFTNIKGLNKETQLARMLLDAMGKKSSAQIGNNLVGLTDWIVASGIPHDPASLALLLGKKIFGSGTGQGALASVLSKGPKLAAPSAEIGALNTNPKTLGLPGAGETSPASNLPPVVHAPNKTLLPEDKTGGVSYPRKR